MILNVSGRTDIVAFYTKWFMKRYHAGFVDVRNPFYPKKVSRINFQNVDAILFCTKNPIPILNHLHEIKHPMVFHVTITPYRKDIEPNVPPKGEIIESIKKLSSIIGKEYVYIRYDPVFLSDEYDIHYHIHAFHHLCELLSGYVKKIIISFIDEYKNVRKNQCILKVKPFKKTDFEQIGKQFSKSAHQYGMHVQTCFEEENLVEFGFSKGECLSHQLAYQLTGKTNFKTWKARGEKKCHCVEMVDIGVYNSCSHFCKYCYANYDENKVRKNMMDHDSSSSLLIGKLNSEDIIKERI